MATALSLRRNLSGCAGGLFSLRKLELQHWQLAGWVSGGLTVTTIKGERSSVDSLPINYLAAMSHRGALNSAGDFPSNFCCCSCIAAAASWSGPCVPRRPHCKRLDAIRNRFAAGCQDGSSAGDIFCCAHFEPRCSLNNRCAYRCDCSSFPCQAKISVRR